MWAVVIRVFHDGRYVGSLQTDIIDDRETIEIFVSGVKFAITGHSEGVTVSTSSTNVELCRYNSWFSGLCSEPAARDIGDVAYEVEATKRRL